ncbi:MAG: hypothetical protein C3F07_01880 [Anaerolineales bacterium]|nr:MAG: hypothetical protein C3F07_01880 [Anaerolineales bacterium]
MTGRSQHEDPRFRQQIGEEMKNSYFKGFQALLFLAILVFNLGYPVGTAHAAPTNDNWASAANVSSVPFTQSISISGATVESGEPQVNVTCDGKLLALGNNTVWYKYTPGATKYVSFDTLGSNYDTYLAVWTGSALNNLTLVGCDDDNDLGYTSLFSFNAQAGTTYYIQVAKFKCLQTGCSPEPGCPPAGADTACSLTFNVKFQTFADVPYDYWAQDFINRLYNAGVTGGCNTGPLIYCPEATVTRAQMAVFLLRGIHGSAYNPPPVGSSTGFNDVSTGYWAAAWIKQLAAEGVTGGCTASPPNYCPDGPVTRAQMAVFLLKAKYGSGYTPPPVGAGTGFTDVPTTYWAAAWIKQLAAEGITGGCGGGNFCPDASVTRAQMAVFLVKTFNLP